MYKNIKIDITYKQNESTHLGNECVILVKEYMNEYKELKALIILLK